MKELLTNKLLTSLPTEDFARLMPALEPVSLAAGQTLSEQGEEAGHLFFPEGSVLSYHCAMQGGESAEVGMIGKEGATSLHALFGSRSLVAQTLSVTIGGSALRLKAEVARREFERTDEFRRALLSYAGEYYAQVSQRAACNALHTVEKRFAVWLLLLADRLGADRFDLTQERIADHLGVRRAGISVLAMQLQNQGIISYRRGHIRLLNRQALAAIACECYKVISLAGEQVLQM